MQNSGQESKGKSLFFLPWQIHTFYIKACEARSDALELGLERGQCREPALALHLPHWLPTCSLVLPCEGPHTHGCSPAPLPSSAPTLSNSHLRPKDSCTGGWRALPRMNPKKRLVQAVEKLRATWTRHCRPCILGAWFGMGALGSSWANSHRLLMFWWRAWLEKGRAGSSW